jgi:hypothetical protein
LKLFADSKLAGFNHAPSRLQAGAPARVAAGVTRASDPFLLPNFHFQLSHFRFLLLELERMTFGQWKKPTRFPEAAWLSFANLFFCTTAQKNCSMLGILLLLNPVEPLFV